MLSVVVAIYIPDSKRAAIVTQTQLVIPKERNPEPE
jgi:hypothetical protein